jgi:hypothetical protein
MSEALLHADIVSFMRSHQGRERAVPRAVLLAQLHRLGHTLTDRTLRRAYAAIPQIGYVVDGEKRGLFWITSREEAREVEGNQHAKAMSALVREKAIREKSLPAGQMELFT